MPSQLDFVPSIPFYRFSSILSGTHYIFDVRWNSRGRAWYVDLLDENEDPIYSGRKIVLGALLGMRQIDDRAPLGWLVAVDLSNEGRDATFDDLGTRVAVYYFEVEELAVL